MGFKVTKLGEVPTKCMNPEKKCQNPLPNPPHVVSYHGKPLVLCSECGPLFRLKAMQES